MSEYDQFSHFLEAQGEVYSSVMEELGNGRKQGHWIWFIFPQLRGLGSSSMNRRFALESVGQAREYFQHPLLGQRLLECCLALLSGEESDPVKILGDVDSMKLHSSMTLFHLAAPECSVFTDVLEKFYAGHLDAATLELTDLA